MRVVLDTNVLIAAFASRGLCESVLELCLSSHEILLSTEILADVQDKLVEKLCFPLELATAVRAFLTDHATLVQPVPVPANACRDPDDVRILGTLTSGGADILVTGDHDLLVLERFDGVPIVTPRTFWEMHRSP